MLAKVSFTFVVILFCAFISNAQTQSKADFTWDELKQVQKEERVLLETMQKETLNRLVTLHTQEMSSLKSESTSNANDLLMLVDKHKQERNELNKTFSEERTKLATIHVEERKTFLINRPKND
jgi:phage-related protein